MSNINIVVEFTAGTSISEAVLEAKDKVIEWVNCCRNKSAILFL